MDSRKHVLAHEGNCETARGAQDREPPFVQEPVTYHTPSRRFANRCGPTKPGISAAGLTPETAHQLFPKQISKGNHKDSTTPVQDTDGGASSPSDIATTTMVGPQVKLDGTATDSMDDTKRDIHSKPTIAAGTSIPRPNDAPLSPESTVLAPVLACFRNHYCQAPSRRQVRRSARLAGGALESPARTWFTPVSTHSDFAFASYYGSFPVLEKIPASVRPAKRRKL